MSQTLAPAAVPLLGGLSDVTMNERPFREGKVKAGLRSALSHDDTREARGSPRLVNNGDDVSDSAGASRTYEPSGSVCAARWIFAPDRGPPSASINMPPAGRPSGNRTIPLSRVSRSTSAVNLGRTCSVVVRTLLTRVNRVSWNTELRRQPPLLGANQKSRSPDDQVVALTISLPDVMASLNLADLVKPGRTELNTRNRLARRVDCPDSYGLSTVKH